MVNGDNTLTLFAYIIGGEAPTEGDFTAAGLTDSGLRISLTLFR